MEIPEKMRLIGARIKKMRKVLVAFSGGVDSSLVLKLAVDALGENALAITSSSPTMPESELEQAKSVASLIGAKHEVIFTQELRNPDYASNPIDRCYFCKTGLYADLHKIASERGFEFILDGANADDVGDFRPGMKAASEQKIISPLKDAGIAKDEVRALAKQLDLPNWNKPSSPCLSSRFPYGTKITVNGLRKVEKAEQFIRNLGIEGNLRVRYMEKLARIEVDKPEFHILTENSDEILRYLTYLGFEFVELDLRGFISGRLNETMLENKEKQVELGK
ncbi:MAG: ATP-dependent sacrificial sulfur transferase LarE [Candidatus Micrarchaeota archaeon]